MNISELDSMNDHIGKCSLNTSNFQELMETNFQESNTMASDLKELMETDFQGSNNMILDLKQLMETNFQELRERGKVNWFK